MMKNILVPTDFSTCARNAEKVAIKLAEMNNSKIHFLHIFNSPFDWVNLPLEKEKLYPEIKHEFLTAERELNKLVKTASKKNLSAKEFLAFNKGREEIDKHIKDHKHDFIVMGSMGASGVKDILGSNTQKVVRYANVPVLVVKESTKNLKIKNVVFASTFEKESESSFKDLIAFAKPYGANIHLLYVNVPFNFKETKEINELMQKFQNKCKGLNCTMNTYNALNEERGILQFSQDLNADIIAMTTHGRTGFLRMISPSLTEKVSNHSDIPVLCLNTKNS